MVARARVAQTEEGGDLAEEVKAERRNEVAKGEIAGRRTRVLEITEAKAAAAEDTVDRGEKTHARQVVEKHQHPAKLPKAAFLFRAIAQVQGTSPRGNTDQYQTAQEQEVTKQARSRRTQTA